MGSFMLMFEKSLYFVQWQCYLRVELYRQYRQLYRCIFLLPIIVSITDVMLGLNVPVMMLDIFSESSLETSSLLHLFDRKVRFSKAIQISLSRISLIIHCYLMGLLS